MIVVIAVINRNRRRATAVASLPLNPSMSNPLYESRFTNPLYDGTAVARGNSKKLNSIYDSPSQPTSVDVEEADA